MKNWRKGWKGQHQTKSKWDKKNDVRKVSAKNGKDPVVGENQR